jgi:hypothetical protein
MKNVLQIGCKLGEFDLMAAIFQRDHFHMWHISRNANRMEANFHANLPDCITSDIRCHRLCLIEQKNICEVESRVR